MEPERIRKILKEAYYVYEAARMLNDEQQIEAIKQKLAAKLGTGSRFKKLVRQLSHKKGITDPKALAAWIGRKKYGKKKFQQLAHKS